MLRANLYNQERKLIGYFGIFAESYPSVLVWNNGIDSVRYFTLQTPEIANAEITSANYDETYGHEIGRLIN